MTLTTETTTNSTDARAIDSKSHSKSRPTTITASAVSFTWFGPTNF